MSLRAKAAFYRKVAMMLLCSFLFQLFYPSAAWALTSGPSQPEFSSFEPISSTEMVDEFTGDFTYNLPVLNVPGPQGSGYSMSLSYHSGAGSEEEASWVGYGWTLNPGAINRNTRGFPDDYKGQQVTYWNKVPNNWTATIAPSGGVEIFSSDIGLGLSTNASLRYNNYTGFGKNRGMGISFGKGLVSLGVNMEEGEQTFSASVSPATLLNNTKDSYKGNDNISKKLGVKPISIVGGNYGIFSFSQAIRPTHVSKYSGESYNYTVGMMGTIAPAEIGYSLNLTGSFSKQDSEEIRNLQAYGFLYAAEGNKDLNAEEDIKVRDYYVEKETPYSKRDVFLGIPFNNADNFMVTGEGVVGGFRLFHKTPGEFFPNYTNSKTKIYQVGGEFHAGAEMGAGGDVGYGEHTLEEGPWSTNEENGENFSSVADQNVDEPVFFRFNNDLGGQWTPIGSKNNASKADQPESAELASTSYKLGHLQTKIAQENVTRSGRSSYIAYFTNEDVKPITREGGRLTKPAKSYSKRMDIENGSFVDRSLAPQGIGEISVFNQQGQRYTYALPVYSKNEHTMQYGALGLKANDIEQNYLIYNKDDHTKVGEERLSPYASTFLLTEVVTPDYVDRELNGPTVDDFGGYTKFNYKRAYGGTNWFKWRTPYRGLSYQKNTLSDQIDDVGTVSDGEKQIYYLQSVVTKTHAAIFITEPRKDALSAEKDEEVAISSRAAQGKEKMEKLVRVELYALSDVSEDANGNVSAKAAARPIKTVHFDYYQQGAELCTSLPNAETAADGKLTLKRVWFEYNGVKTGVKISPYVFEYTYPNTAVYPEKYQAGGTDDLTQGYSFSSQAQNPTYSPFMLDAWGNYQYGGAERFANMKHWLNQNPSKTDIANFDPAAWQLKRIVLPSGGEIHVQYEQDDYAYVQDKFAHAMVSLASSDRNLFTLDVAKDITLPTERIARTAYLDAMANLLTKVYITNPNRQKIYYKILYKLFGANPQINDCLAEYITGYAEVEKIGAIDYANGQITILLKVENGANPDLPQSVCENFVATQRAGKLNKDADCNPVENGLGDPFKPKAIEVVKKLVDFLGFKIGKTVYASNSSLSYFKIPVLTKKGGGLRVKRLLMLDYQEAGKPTPSSEGPALYGNEYIYQALDDITGTYRTSGVATNEPTTIREENALVEDIPRKGQSKVSKILFGLDRKHSEGPIGESVYPGPSVGYSCVIVRNIHSGITTPGYSMKTFHTARKFPVIVKQTEIKSKTEYGIAPFGLFNSFVNNMYMTQGFSIILNDMHGKPNSITTYPGTYSALALKEKPVPTSQYTYTYYAHDPAELVPVIDQFGGAVSMENPGKEIDITFAHRAVKDNTVDGNLEVDSGAMILLIPLPFMSFMPSLTRSQLEMYTHTTSKVIRYPAIVKSATVTQDGITHTSENLAFDRYTGEAVAVRSYDEFAQVKNSSNQNLIDQPGYLSHSVMAPWQYPQMGAKALRDGMTKKANTNGIGEITFDNNRLYFQGSAPGVATCITDFTSGDLLEITGARKAKYYYHAGKIGRGNSISVYPYPGGAVMNNADFVASVRVVQSGRTNQLKVAAGSYNFHHTNGSLLSLLATTPKAPAMNNSNLVPALNAALAELQAMNPVEGKQGELTSFRGKTFDHLNIAEFSDWLKPEWKVNANDATLSEMVVHYKVAEGEAILKIVAFKINGQYTVKID